MKNPISLIHPDAALNSKLMSFIGGGGNPPNITQKTSAGIDRTVHNDLADGRDILSMLVGSGTTSLKGHDMNSAFNRLKDVVGAPLAQKLATQAFLYNQRPDAQKLSPEQRVQNFFKIGSNDPAVADYMKKSGYMGTGPVDAFRNSATLHNSNLQGKYLSNGATNPGVATAIQSLIGKRM
jgi:hypothetical protein